MKQFFIITYLPNKAVLYQVDPQNRRSVKIVNGQMIKRYVWEGQLRVVAELDANNLLQSRFIYADGVNSPEYMVKYGRKYIFVKDHRGSINLVIDSESGEIKQKIRYSDWGEVLEDSNPGFQPFGFAGGLYDHETKLVRFGARDYDGETGRWLSKDPIRFEGGDSNLYGYVLQDPINWVDPYGKSFDSVVGGGMIIGGAVVVGTTGGLGAVAGVCMIAVGAKMIRDDRAKQLQKELLQQQKKNEAAGHDWNGLPKE